MNRRNFLQRAAFGTGLFLPISSLFLGKNAKGASAPSQTPPLSANDVALATIATNQEYLQNEYYLRVLTGTGLSAQDTSGLGPAGTVLAPKVNPLKFNNPTIKAIAEQLAQDELAHLRIIRNSFTSFGLTPPARPTIDLESSFQTLAETAGIDRRFNPFESETDFLLVGFFLEQIDGPTLTGGIDVLENATLRSTAVSLLGDETSHNGSIRVALAQEKLIDDANKIAALSQKLVSSAQTIIHPLFDGRLLLSPVGDDGIVAPLNPRQFLNIVYLSINANAGGFYPNGLNFA
jgi:Ferritin-like domain